VCGISAQHDTTLHQTLGDSRIDLPKPDRQHLDIEIIDADGVLDPLRRTSWV